MGECSYVAEPLVLGNLTGNEFTVTLRNVRPLVETAEEPPATLEARARAAVASLRQTGFMNYFGLQRFGAASGARTHVVGAAVLRGDWAAAVDLILAPRADEARAVRRRAAPRCSAPGPAAAPGLTLALACALPCAQRGEVAEARRLWSEKRDAKAALRAMPAHMLAERAVLQKLLADDKARPEANVAPQPRAPRSADAWIPPPTHPRTARPRRSTEPRRGAQRRPEDAPDDVPPRLPGAES